MSYQVLARKWRPRSFDTLVGQEHVVRALTHALEAGRLHHAYLFTGTRGVGKTTVARILAKALNCELGVGPNPCGKCSSCLEIEASRFVDLLEVDAATNTRVEEMRSLLENAIYAPTRGRYKVYVIDEVHMLSSSAFNAMLKTLEEPPDHVKFILATTDPQKIPVTVLSRCLQFNLKPMTKPAIAGHLQHVLDAEGIEFEVEATRLISQAAQGSMRDALSLLDQAIAHGKGRVEAEGVQQMLGLAGSEQAGLLLTAALHGDPARAVAVVRDMAVKSLSFTAAVHEMASLLVQVQLLQLGGEVWLAEDGRPGLSEIADSVAPELIQLAYQILIRGADELKYAPDPEAGITMLILRICAFRPREAPAPENPGDRGNSIRSLPERVVAGASSKAQPKSAGSNLDADARSVSESGSVASVGSCEGLEWEDLVPQLGLTGMARELAQHCEVADRTETVWRMRLSPSHRHLLVPVSQDRVQKAIAERLKAAVRVDIELADPIGETLAKRGFRARQQAQDQAVQSIEGDPFVQKIVEVFDATIIESSIKPLASEGK